MRIAVQVSKEMLILKFLFICFYALLLFCEGLCLSLSFRPHRGGNWCRARMVLFLLAYCALKTDNHPLTMTIIELRQALLSKTLEFELAMELGKPHNELLKIYKQIKKL